MIAIVDYRAGNLTSVARALHYLGEHCLITSDLNELRRADRIIFPGVGAAGEAMANLRQRGLDHLLSECVQGGKPVLGICLGTQVILEHSEENDTACLGVVAGNVKRFPENLQLKIPHMGWNHVDFRKNHPVFHGLPEGSEFYFVHSYYPAPADPELVAGWTEYGLRFCAALTYRNLAAVQFHPEKSGRPGLKILSNFCRWKGGEC